MSANIGNHTLVLSKIEFSMLFLVEQLLVPSHPKKIRLKTSVNEDEPAVEYAPRLKEKLAHDICVISQVHSLLRNGQYSTKRDLYYDNKLLYGTQAKFDRSLTNACHIINCERGALNVLSSSKGLLMGSLTLLSDDGSLIDCRKQTVLIAESLTTYRPLSSARFILVAEKDAAFQKLIDDDFFELFDESILVTGKGYPDICTRKFLRWIVDKLSIPIYGLFDADPHGIEILLTYKYGSGAEKAEGRGAYVKKMQWLGVKPSDLMSMQIAEKQRLSMVYRDYNKIVRIRKRAIVLGETEIVKELDILREQKHKCEIESISSIGHRFLPRFYLFPKLSHL